MLHRPTFLTRRQPPVRRPLRALPQTLRLHQPAQRWGLLVGLLLAIALASPSHALDLVAFSGITGPMTSALTQIAALGPGIKALVGFVGFVVTADWVRCSSLAANVTLRYFSSVYRIGSRFKLTLRSWFDWLMERWSGTRRWKASVK